MRIAYYKAAVVVLALATAFASLMAYQYAVLFFDRPSLADADRRAYLAYICELQRDLGYPVCHVGDVIYEFGETDFYRDGPDP